MYHRDMEHGIYERPREKLQIRGVKSLTNSELLQLIISSGGKYSSVAHIAKQVTQTITNYGSNCTYQHLIAIKGLGHAKVCQILAVLEFGQRFVSSVTESKSETIPMINEYETLQQSRKRKVIALTVSGDTSVINQYTYSAFTHDNALSVIKKIFTFALRDQANAVVIGVGFRNQVLTPTDDETLAIVSKIYQTSELVGVLVNAVWLVNGGGKQRISKRWLVS